MEFARAPEPALAPAAFPRNQAGSSSMSSDKATSRRQVVGGLSTGFMALSAQAVAQQAPSQASSEATLPNPVTEYARPPFPKQEQEWPGLAGRMTPRPDHGE